MTKCLFANFWFIFACFDFVKMFATILYFAIYDFARMLKYDEMFIACSWHIYRCSHVQILTKCLQWFVFRNLWSCLHVCDSNSRMFQFERNVLTIDLYFAFDLLSYYIWKNTRVSTKCLDKKFIFRNFRFLSHVQILNRVCMLKLCSMFNKSFRLLDSITYVLKCFSSKCSIKNCLYCRRFFYWNLMTRKAIAC